MTEAEIPARQVPPRLKWPLRLTRLGMTCERLLRGFWPLATILMLTLAALMFGAHEALPLEVTWAAAVIAVLAFAAALFTGLRGFRLPSRAEAMARLDETMPGRPLAALLDSQAIGATDAASRAVWEAHRRRMAERAAAARPVQPDLRISGRDPFALRYAALLALVMALLFGSVLRVGSVVEMAPGGRGTGVASGPAWEGWIEPPAYTGRPSLYLNDIPPGRFDVPEGSTVTLRFYGEVGALTLAETVSGRIGELPPAAEPSQEFRVMQSGTLSIDGPGGASWQIAVIPDEAPEVRLDGPAERAASGEMQQPFSVRDDYGVQRGQAVISLDLDAVPRRFGYVRDPEPREEIVLDLPMTISGDRAEFSETLIENLSEHPWAGLPVTLTMIVADAAEQEGSSAPAQMELPGRRFFDPLAAAIVEERRELLWHVDNARRVSQVLRAVSYRPDDIFESATTYLKLRVALRRLETAHRFGTLTPEIRDEIAAVLWDIAVQIEEGQLAGALERLRQAEDRLSEAIRRGASEDEIAELMQELREAMDNYMRQLAQQGQQGDQQQMSENTQTITGDQLQQMMDRLQELMEQGRMAEAQELLDQLRQMMENMQVAEGQQGEGGESPGEQAMNGLGETLRQQQGLNDETFGDLQDQFGQSEGQLGEGQEGQGDGQQGNPQEGGQQGSEGQGPSGREQGRGGQSEGQGNGQQGERGDAGSGAGGQEGGSLADRQQALRDELERQRGNLPGAGTEEGEAAREALGRAGRAMDRAEEALRQRDYADALDNQSEAMEALREGMRNLADQLAQQRSQQRGDQGEAMDRNGSSERRDPLGRNSGVTGQIGTQESMLQGEDVYRRARELLDEIRRRSADQERPDAELEYLRRLLERF